MSHGITLKMVGLSRRIKDREPQDRPAREVSGAPRDRSLRGKARIRARRAA